MKLSGFNLHTKGDVSILENPKRIAIVGSRKMTSYGERVLEKFILELVNEKYVIVSGYMYGVDMTAHNLTLEYGGKTIAVLGWGLAVEPLKINKNILYLSEYEDDQKSQLWMFPRRNRIVAKISGAVIVIEAGEKSGSLITARYAQSYGKKLYAVPGPITSLVSRGTNLLIKEGKAEMLVDARDITRSHLASGIDTSVKMRSFAKGQTLIGLLQTESLSIDEMARKLTKSSQEISVELSMLELRGAVKKEGGKYFVI